MSSFQKLKWLIVSGITQWVGETPVNRLTPATEKTILPVSNDPPPQADTSLSQAIELAKRATTIDELYRARATFDGCALKKTAAHTLNGRGNKTPTVLCLTEAPDTADERDGSLMSGEAGVLFDKMLSAIGLSLTQNTYVSSLIPWRTPGNRKPTAVEHALCRPFWEKEIQLLSPKIILIFGAGAADAILGISSLTKARGAWHDYHSIPVRVSIPPSALIRLPAQKKQAWDDLQQVQAKLKDLI